jgi:hypothetical protein
MAIPLPTPRLAPVTTATFPLRSLINNLLAITRTFYKSGLGMEIIAFGVKGNIFFRGSPKNHSAAVAALTGLWSYLYW